MPGGRRILVPNPAAFLVQKILIHEKRDRNMRAKDILYIHDTIREAARIATGRNVTPEMVRELWRMDGSKYLYEARDLLAELSSASTGFVSTSKPLLFQLLEKFAHLDTPTCIPKRTWLSTDAFGRRKTKAGNLLRSTNKSAVARISRAGQDSAET